MVSLYLEVEVGVEDGSWEDGADPRRMVVALCRQLELSALVASPADLDLRFWMGI